ncbi:hypothetical protein BV898_00062 [Hypsibius exemplaris]|uniref:Uncharacterized protein n=1 Tax=Hypsibius exemplaris TaxID=2072580 RepID=A0A1W0XEK6_HYPEX|nr:hypothetical protein BV898_00062 [Hypsibius exemplaris]
MATIASDALPCSCSCTRANRAQCQRQSGTRRHATRLRTYFGIVGDNRLGMGLWYMDTMTETGAGLWGGAVFIATGIVGILATRPNPLNVSRKGLFIGFLGMSVFSSVLSAGMIAFCIISLIVGDNIYYYTYYNSYNYDSYDYNSYNYNSAAYWGNFFYRNRDAFLGIRILSLFIYATQFVFYIITSAFSCCDVCTSNQANAAVVYHVHDGQPQQQFHGPPQPQFTTLTPGNVNYANMQGMPVHSPHFQPPPPSYAPDMQQHFNETSKRGG